jgi:hypothetical protein
MLLIDFHPDEVIFMENERLRELNTRALFLLKELMKLKFKNLEQISIGDFTPEDPTLGYSLGFSSADLKDTVTLYLFSGDSHPINSQTLKRYHLAGARDIIQNYPELHLDERTIPIEYFLSSGDEIGYLKTSFEGTQVQDKRIIVSTSFFGLLVKVRATIESENCEILDHFLEKFFKGLTDAFMKISAQDVTSLQDLQ